MNAYIKTVKLMDNTVANEASEEGVFDDYAEGASRLFDKLCEVSDGFFNKAESAAAARTFYGNGIDMIQLPPYVGNIVAENILIDGDEIEDEFRLINGYLINKDRAFDEDETIVVTARWGFENVPKDVEIVVNELAAHLWRNKDPMFTKISNIETERELSPTVNAVIKKYRDKYSQGAY